jgi:hypothetical protein
MNSFAEHRHSNFNANLLSRNRVTVHVDRVWIDDSVHCTLWYCAWLQITIHYYTHYCLQSRLHCRRLVAASNNERSPSPYFPNCRRPQPPASNGNSSWQLNPSSSLTATQAKSKSKSWYDRRSVGQSISLSSPIWGLRPDFLYCQTPAGLLMWGALSDGSVVYIWWWSSPTQSFSGPSRVGLMTILDYWTVPLVIYKHQLVIKISKSFALYGKFLFLKHTDYCAL